MTHSTPDHAMQVATQHHRAGRARQAEEIYRQVLERHPDHVPALQGLALLSYQMGRNEIAVDMMRRALSLRLDDAEGYSNLANVLTAMGRLDEAVAACRQAITLRPGFAEAHNNLGNALTIRGEFEQAVAAYRQATAVNPNYADAHANLGTALKSLGCLDESISTYRRAITINPGSAAIHYNLAIALKEAGQIDHAIAAYEKAIALRPDLAEAHGNLGIALAEKGQCGRAISAYRRAIALSPNYSEAYHNLGIALADMGELDGAIAAYRRAIVLRPNDARLHNNLGSALKDQGRLDEALTSYRQAMTLDPSAAEFHSNFVYTTCFHPDYGPERQLEAAQEWARRHAAPVARDIGPHDNDPSPDRRLRIGYVSPNFRNHVVGRNVLPVVENHDHSRFEIHCFAGVKRADALTARFQENADKWHDTTRLSDAGLAELVRHERIDILVDLCLHMEGSRLLAFARKPAPVQVTWAGYPGTTGLDTIDYRLTDPYLDPIGAGHDSTRVVPGDEFYSEKSIRLPHSFWCFRPPEHVPQVNPLPALSNGFVTFGCFNNLCKVTGPAIDLWAKVLLSAPASRMRILSPPGGHRETAFKRFQAAGVGPDRIDFVGPRPLPEYFRLYQTIDVALDPLPYTGHSSSLDAFWMGVPVVTLAGATVASRGGMSIVRNLMRSIAATGSSNESSEECAVESEPCRAGPDRLETSRLQNVDPGACGAEGFPQLIAQSIGEYVRIAYELACDLRTLGGLRASLRERMRNSSLTDEIQFTRDLEAAYQMMWRRRSSPRGAETG